MFQWLGCFAWVMRHTLVPAIRGVVSETSALRRNSVEIASAVVSGIMASTVAAMSAHPRAQLWHGDADREHRSCAADENEFGAEPVETVAHRRHDRGGDPRTVQGNLVLIQAMIAVDKAAR